MAYQTQGYDNQPFMQSGGYNNAYGPVPGAAPGGSVPQTGPVGYPSNMPGAGAYAPGGFLQKPMNVVSDWSVIFFAASCSIMLGALVSSIALFFSFELIDFLEMSYLLIFGGVLALMDTPCFKNMKTVADHRMYFSKYVNLLTRVTGKGLTFLFLGCSLFSGMWENLEGGFLLFLAFILSLTPTLVGIAALVIGFMKSQKLKRARDSVALDEMNVSNLFDQFARTYPEMQYGLQGGLTQMEFNELTYAKAGMKWEDADLKLIFNALVSNPAWRMNQAAPGAAGQNPNVVELAKIPKQDFMSWVAGGIVWL